MDAFEQVVSEILWMEGFWVRTSVKVDLTLKAPSLLCTTLRVLGLCCNVLDGEREVNNIVGREIERFSFRVGDLR